MYGLSQQDLDIQARARTFADELIPYEVEAELNNGDLPKDVVAAHKARAIELGLFATNMPVSLGGQGYSSLQQVLVQEQVGRVTNALAWVAATPPSWLPAVATPEQLERFVLPTVRGEREECYAITEEGAGSDVDGIVATARRDGDEYLLNGEKWHVTSYNSADYAFFQGKLSGGEHDGEHAMFLVDLPSPGVTVVRTPPYTHTISHHHPIVAFTDVRVPAGNLVGAEGDGMSFAYEWFRFERMMVAARCLGGAQRLVEEITSFSRERTVQGQPIAALGAIQSMLADCLTELFATRSMVYETARGIDAGADVKVQHAQCSMAKLYASEMAGRVADRAVQIFGGRGYMRENVAERLFRELRVERIWEGTSEVQRSIIADQMIKRGPRALA
ncbi:MAG TPA: acyl-CoA dehydrogenase family protein [Streptosporangiaceae bacterium]|jgi:alkylation response protein AidB-like acyl-CoA dehydrogenase|nr:acyl-CoA dehydrogenase family protein [Streptosporangiaceae bacterium]